MNKRSSHQHREKRGRAKPHGRTNRSRRDNAPANRSTEDVLYGRQPVAECLKAGRRKVRWLTVSDRARPATDLDKILHLAEAASLPVQRIPPHELDDRLGDVNHQGVCLSVSPYPYVPIETALASTKNNAQLKPLVLALDHIQDPQNLGAILRNADGAGVSAVLIPKDRACAITPTVVRASAGATEHMAIVRVTNLVRSLRTLKEDNFWIAGLESCEGSSEYHHTDLSAHLCLVIGSEGNGMGRLVRETCDMLISLPMHGKVGSLNAASATGIALYEIRRQQLGST
ncbi:MAG: 23S rRNA (guanosine(2251)-2'-O)-methyltransferase RlmB [Kiritimatiellae bacterium]|nr:23S rRNA (guanosine(2251)-2'-O)-methyltransferase RlmB [Kiritimatiellia bacterium]